MQISYQHKFIFKIKILLPDASTLWTDTSAAQPADNKYKNILCFSFDLIDKTNHLMNGLLYCLMDMQQF